MKITTSTKITIGLVLIQLVTLICELFLASHHTIFVTFITFTCVILFIYLIQWIAFKTLNSQIRRNRLKESNTDRQSVEMLIDRKQDGELSAKEIIAARRLRGWLLIYTLIVPLIVSVVISITFAYV